MEGEQINLLQSSESEGYIVDFMVLLEKTNVSVNKDAFQLAYLMFVHAWKHFDLHMSYLMKFKVCAHNEERWSQGKCSEKNSCHECTHDYIY